MYAMGRAVRRYGGTYSSTSGGRRRSHSDMRRSVGGCSGAGRDGKNRRKTMSGW